VKNNPVYFPEIFNIFHQPLFITIAKPTKENPRKKIKIKFNSPSFNYFFFITNKSYVLNKLKKKGRIKRKVTKKLVAKNRLTD